MKTEMRFIDEGNEIINSLGVLKDEAANNIRAGDYIYESGSRIAWLVMGMIKTVSNKFTNITCYVKSVSYADVRPIIYSMNP